MGDCTIQSMFSNIREITNDYKKDILTNVCPTFPIPKYFDPDVLPSININEIANILKFIPCFIIKIKVTITTVRFFFTWFDSQML